MVWGTTLFKTTEKKVWDISVIEKFTANSFKKYFLLEINFMNYKTNG
jgi:hypothetical protein